MASEQPSPEEIIDRLYEVKQELALKAANDSSFRKSLQDNPLLAIEKEYNLPAGLLAQNGLNVEIVEEKPNSLVVPIPPSMDDVELSDDQLEAVAGGGVFTVGLTIAVIGAVGGIAAAGVTATGAVTAAGIGAAGGVAAAGVKQGW